MSKRWERELERLDDVEVPTARIRARADDGPTGPGGPERSGGQRLVAGVVAFAVFAAAGVFAWQMFRPPGGSQLGIAPADAADVTVSFVLVDGPNGSNPKGTLTVGDQATHGFTGSHCWDFPGGSGCADTIAPSFEPRDFITAEAGSTLTVSGDANRVDGEIDRDGSFPFDRVRDLGTITDPVVLDLPPGRYVLSLVAHFDQGDVPYYFPIQIVEWATSTDAPSTSAMEQRIGVYEAMIRRLADPHDTGPVYVSTELCSMLSSGCHDRLSEVDQAALSSRLADLGTIEFRGHDAPLREGHPEILLGPIEETADGLRVEGGSICGSLCGSGAMYVVAPTGDGYQVTGTDPAYGSWVS